MEKTMIFTDGVIPYKPNTHATLEMTPQHYPFQSPISRCVQFSFENEVPLGRKGKPPANPLINTSTSINAALHWLDYNNFFHIYIACQLISH